MCDEFKTVWAMSWAATNALYFLGCERVNYVKSCQKLLKLAGVF